MVGQNGFVKTLAKNEAFAFYQKAVGCRDLRRRGFRRHLVTISL